MKWARHRRFRFFFAFLALALAIVTLVARLSRVSRDGKQNVLTWSKSESQNNRASTSQSSAEQQENSANPLSKATPLPPSAIAPLPDNRSSQTESPANLIIPVAGVRPDQLRDSFSEARSEGRVHDAIDIPAPQGTPVLAVADGSILKLFHSDRGGTTIYQLSTDKKFVYYYAHLDRYADGLTESHFARQGETIAYVGDSGNAEAGNYHLHFSITLISDPKRYWEGTNINPYPLLKK